MSLLTLALTLTSDNCTTNAIATTKRATATGTVRPASNATASANPSHTPPDITFVWMGRSSPNVERVPPGGVSIVFLVRAGCIADGTRMSFQLMRVRHYALQATNLLSQSHIFTLQNILILHGTLIRGVNLVRIRL
uniref:Putative secreted peptide n=1 Tax=Anopheles braziliensis TaxID=58242 RepID=A0A2M3ZQL9_9DIPT